MKNSIITLLFVHFVLFSFSQDIGYEVFATYKRPILKEQLIDVETLSDINPGFPSSWISSYVSVEILTTSNDEVMKAVSSNDKLSDKQLSILKMAEIGTDIVVDVKYYSESLIKDDAIKNINFSFTVIPKTEAEYPGGYQLLKQYLKENTIDKFSNTIGKDLQSAKVKFIIDEDGQITDTQISQTSGNEEIDKILLSAISNMPNWNPAKNSDGTKVKQEFEFSVGNMIGC